MTASGCAKAGKQQRYAGEAGQQQEQEQDQQRYEVGILSDTKQTTG